MNLDIHSLIIYEDPSVIVCRKPAGIPTQSSRIAASDMVSLLKNYLAASSQCGSAGRKPRGQNRKEPYLAVIHRLDQPVEGLLVFAKTPAAARNLSGQLTGAGFGKYYLAMVRGIPSPSEGDLEDHLPASVQRILPAQNMPGSTIILSGCTKTSVRRSPSLRSVLTPGVTTRSGYRCPIMDFL